MKEEITGGTFFQRALALIKPPLYKLMVVVVFAVLLAPQVVRGYEKPTLALLIIVLAIVIFAIAIVALEFRDRQVAELVRERDILKQEVRQLVLEKRRLENRRQPLKATVDSKVKRQGSASSARSEQSEGVEALRGQQPTQRL